MPTFAKNDSGVICDPSAWYDDESENDIDDYAIDLYDISASPNDFNITTIFNFIESGALSIPGFQRNYVWDLKRASKLMESLIIGIPVPQVFLYEESRNKFLVIDGQQRLMSIYYFIKQRFPKKEKRADIRRVFEQHGRIPDDVLHNDDLFSKFNLTLPARIQDEPNRFNGLNYSTLGEHKTSFDLRTIRNIIVKQLSPKNDNSAIYEIFNRLNSGGINLTPQEIRMSLYHSHFYDMLARTNTKKAWRDIVGISDPDLHAKDIEMLLRGFAMLIAGDRYKPSMMRFLNFFSRDVKKIDEKKVLYFENLFESFLRSMQNLHPRAFFNKAGRFSITIFESVFSATCFKAYRDQDMVVGYIEPSSLQALISDSEFVRSSEFKTADTRNVENRLKRGSEIIRVTG